MTWDDFIVVGRKQIAPAWRVCRRCQLRFMRLWPEIATDDCVCWECQR